MLKRMEIGIGGGGFNFSRFLSIKESALKFSLLGIAFIRDDGAIKVIAEGEEKNLINFENELSNANFFLYTESFYSRWYNAQGEFKNFSVMDKYLDKNKK